MYCTLNMHIQLNIELTAFTSSSLYTLWKVVTDFSWTWWNINMSIKDKGTIAHNYNYYLSKADGMVATFITQQVTNNIQENCSQHYANAVASIA